MASKNISINFGEVKKQTNSIKKASEKNLTNYAEKKYSNLISAMKNCKGSYKNVIVEELEEEQKVILETAKFIKKLQNMIQETAEQFSKVDKSYKKGAKM